MDRLRTACGLKTNLLRPSASANTFNYRSNKKLPLQLVSVKKSNPLLKIPVTIIANPKNVSYLVRLISEKLFYFI